MNILFAVLNFGIGVSGVIICYLFGPKLTYWREPVHNRNLILVPSIVLATFHLIVGGFSIQLYLYHLWLMKNNLSTLEHILSKREAQKKVGSPNAKTGRVFPMGRGLDENHKTSPILKERDTERFVIKDEPEQSDDRNSMPTPISHQNEKQDSERTNPIEANPTRHSEEVYNFRVKKVKKHLEKKGPPETLFSYSKRSSGVDSAKNLIDIQKPERAKTKPIFPPLKGQRQTGEFPEI